jgi:hypothetical protein
LARGFLLDGDIFCSQGKARPPGVVERQVLTGNVREAWDEITRIQKLTGMWFLCTMAILFYFRVSGEGMTGTL